MQIAFQRDDQADDVLLRGLRGPPDAVVRAAVRQRGADQVGPPGEDAGGLRPVQFLAAAVGDEVRALRDEARQVLRRGQHRRRIHEDGNAVPVGDLAGLRERERAPARPRRGEIFDERRLLRERRFELIGDRAVAVADLDDRRARHAEGVVVAIAVRAVNDRLVLHAGAVRQLRDLDRVGPRHAGSGGEEQARLRAARHHPGLRARRAGDHLARLLPATLRAGYTRPPPRASRRALPAA